MSEDEALELIRYNRIKDDDDLLESSLEAYLKTLPYSQLSEITNKLDGDDFNNAMKSRNFEKLIQIDPAFSNLKNFYQQAQVEKEIYDRYPQSEKDRINLADKQNQEDIKNQTEIIDQNEKNLQDQATTKTKPAVQTIADNNWLQPLNFFTAQQLEFNKLITNFCKNKNIHGLFQIILTIKNNKEFSLEITNNGAAIADELENQLSQSFQYRFGQQLFNDLLLKLQKDNKIIQQPIQKILFKAQV